MLLAFNMLLSLVFLPFNIYLLVHLSILPLLFLFWNFLFESHEYFLTARKKYTPWSAYTVLQSLLYAYCRCDSRDPKHDPLSFSVPAPSCLGFCSCWRPCHDCPAAPLYSQPSYKWQFIGKLSLWQTGLDSQSQLCSLGVYLYPF